MPQFTLKINGRTKSVVCSPDKVLLDLLREDLHLTGAKQSCDRKGQCGACSVIVNGKVVRSCLTKVASLDNADVLTVEGLGTPDNPHLIQEAFVLSGAVQCGYCTPGMIMTAKGLLDRNPDPDVGEIKKAFAGNLCRCTGYVKIIEAVQMAGRFLRGESSPEKEKANLGTDMMGVSHPRPTAMLKACGVAEFSADIKLDGALELAVVRSTESHAKILSIDTSEAEKMPGVEGVMTSKDIRGTNRIRAVSADMPVLCDDRIRTIGDPIAIVAADTRVRAQAAADAVVVKTEPLPVMLTPSEALAENAVRVHEEYPNLCFQQPQIKGDAQQAFESSAAVVEAEFTTQLNHQAPLEPEATVAWLEEEDEEEEALLVVAGRSIMIHTHMAALQDALGWENMRYEEAFSGGQFGIKASVTSEGISGAAALHFKRPVRYIPSIHESMLLTPKRHPFAMKVKLGADKDGRLTAYANDFTVDNGAYMHIGIVVINRALRMLSGAYHIPNVDVMSRLVYTNNAAGGAARGAGPPQVNFALESAMDMLAEKLGMDPLEFRQKNTLVPGQSVSTGTIVEQWPFAELCELIRPHFDRARKDAASFDQGHLKRGVGIGAHSFGIGSPGDSAQVALELDPDDGVTIYAAVADPGEGNDSMLAQIAAHLLHIPQNKVRLVTRDTDRALATGPAAGSRMTFMAGGALVDAVEQLKATMKDAGASTYRELTEAGKPNRYIGRKKNPEGDLDSKTGQGATFVSQVHNVQMAEVEVNTETGEVRVLKMTTAVDPGPVIHPKNLEGQLEGGMDQGVGYALREEYLHGKTKDWISFKYPTMKTAFDMEIITPRETPRKNGALGSTGIGEMTMVSTAPAVINAIKDACGVRIFNLPATPEKIKDALKDIRHESVTEKQDTEKKFDLPR